MIKHVLVSLSEQSQPQKATPPTPVNGGKENVSPPSEGEKKTGE